MSNDTQAINRLFKLQTKIDMMVLDGRRDATTVADALQAILEEKQRRLTTLTSVAVAGNSINPHDFFKTRKGLWMSNNFNDFILSAASKKKVSADEATAGFTDLAQVANDPEIGSELPEDYVFEDIDTFLVHLATLIKGQWGGKSGTLLSNGYANIFYVKVNGKVFTVFVHWVADYWEWGCGAYRLGGLRWDAGYRAFSATAA